MTLRGDRIGRMEFKDVLSRRRMVRNYTDDPVEQAANTMRERKIGCLPVVDEDELVGIITETDVLRYFAGVLP